MNSFHLESGLYIHSVSTGFIDVPGQISLNVYVHGCMKSCPGCQNSELQEFKKENFHDSEKFKMLLNRYAMCNWVCFLGGDAVYQPKGLEALAKTSKECGKKVCLYTGLNYGELDHLDKSNIDLIIDGEYIEDLGGLQSSNTNQSCYLKMDKHLWKTFKFSQLLDVLQTK